MLELVPMFSLEVNEKEQAPLGQRIRAVGMCFYKREDLKKGNNYQLRGQAKHDSYGSYHLYICRIFFEGGE